MTTKIRRRAAWIVPPIVAPKFLGSIWLAYVLLASAIPA
jgi:hypothetical protein